jgi:hypothetical protein
LYTTQTPWSTSMFTEGQSVSIYATYVFALSSFTQWLVIIFCVSYVFVLSFFTQLMVYLCFIFFFISYL